MVIPRPGFTHQGLAGKTEHGDHQQCCKHFHFHRFLLDCTTRRGVWRDNDQNESLEGIVLTDDNPFAEDSMPGMSNNRFVNVTDATIPVADGGSWELFWNCVWLIRELKLLKEC